MKHKKNILALLFLTVMLYVGIASTVFQWRNPTANQMSFWRDFSSVMTFKKLDKYQGAK
jgi:hypothetical protein